MSFAMVLLGFSRMIRGDFVSWSESPGSIGEVLEYLHDPDLDVCGNTLDRARVAFEGCTILIWADELTVLDDKSKPEPQL